MGKAGSTAKQAARWSWSWWTAALIYIVLGALEVAFASSWKNSAGVAVGSIALALGGIMLLGAGIRQCNNRGDYQQFQPEQPSAAPQPSPSFGARLRRAMQTPSWRRGMLAVRVVLWLFGIYVALLVAFHLASPDPRITTFPTSCPRNKLQGCSRVAYDNPNKHGDLAPEHVPAPKPAVLQAVKDWIPTQRGQVLFATDSFVHARMVSRTWGFADDFLVELSCQQDGTTRVQVQGMLRIGIADMGVNQARNAALLLKLHSMTVKGEFPSGSC